MQSRRRTWSVVLLVAATVSAGCGESKEEKAIATVCDSRDSIQTRVDTLRSLPLSQAGLEQAGNDLKGIQADIGKMVDAQADLGDDRKQQVTSATNEFSRQVDSLVEELTSSGASGDAKARLKSAVAALGSAYRGALEPIDCN